jgi:hypothetical protein
MLERPSRQPPERLAHGTGIEGTVGNESARMGRFVSLASSKTNDTGDIVDIHNGAHRLAGRRIMRYVVESDAVLLGRVEPVLVHERLLHNDWGSARWFYS